MASSPIERDTIHSRSDAADGDLARDDRIGALLVVRYVLQEPLRLRSQS